MRVREVTSVLCLAALSGCGAGGGQAPSRAALGFAQAVSAGDGAAACAMLAPGTRHELESSAGLPCTKAVLRQHLPSATRVAVSERYGDEARVVLDDDTTFVARFSIGWRVVAAGCRDR